MRFGCILVVAAIGCGNSDGGSDGGGIRDKPLGQLTPDEQQQACELLQGAYDDYLASFPADKGCTFSAVWTAREAQTEQAALREQCASLRDECLAAYEGTNPAVCMVPESCTATVAEWERCYDELVANYDGLYDDVPECETLTLETAAALMLPAELPTTPASCVSAQMKCSVDEPDPPPIEDPLIAACTESCNRYEATCSVSVDTCASWCNAERFLSEPYGCLELTQSYYECAASAEIDCTRDGIWFAVDSACGITDVLICRRYEGASCGRVDTFDTYCSDALPDQPEAFECISSVAYGECLDHPTYGTLFRCCPAGTTF